MLATDPRPEPQPPDASPAALTRRALAWTGLGALLAGAAVTRLSGAVPASADGGGLGAVELVSLSPEQAAAALASASMTEGARAGMLDAIRERRLHLVRAPFYGVDGVIGARITVTCGASVRPIVLAASPTIVLLPIERLGRIVVSSTERMPDDARIGLLTASGPALLPPVGPAHALSLAVIVQ